MVVGTEICDDGIVHCNADCLTFATGWNCTGGGPSSPSTCNPICGDGLIKGLEICDDGNKNSSDGCSSTCTVETNSYCVG